MEITICSPEKDSLEIIIGALSNKGFECSKIYSKKKYWLFGKVMYCTDFVSMEIGVSFAPGGVAHRHGGVVSDGIFIHQGNMPIDPYQAGKNLRKLIEELNKIPCVGYRESEGSMQEQLDAAIESEDFELAAVIRDKMIQFKDQKK